MRAAVYLGTRNLYRDMLSAMKSLAAHARVDKIYLLIEDPAFPFPLPELVEAIDVSGQSWISRDAPAAASKWTWMGLLRCVYPLIFPELDQIVSLDADTLVEGPVGDLWELELGDKLIAGCREPFNTFMTGRLYINTGVTVYNLAKMREEGTGAVMQKLAHERDWLLSAQDITNQACAGRILELGSEYNVCPYTDPSFEVKVRHFAARDDWRELPEVRRWRETPWRSIL